jgi:alpha-galactosidase
MHNRTTNGWIAAGGMTDSEYLLHFALWCALQSPLMIGCDVRKLGEATLQTLTNKALLAINQDPAARPLFQINGKGEGIGDDFIAFKHMANGEYLLLAVNFGEEHRTLDVEFFDFGLPAGSGLGLRLRNVITGEDIGLQSDYMRIPVSSHGFKMYRGPLVRL